METEPRSPRALRRALVLLAPCLALSLAGRPARAAEPDHDRPVELFLMGTEPNLRLELYAPGQKIGRDRPMRICLQPCALAALPGRYRVQVSGPPGSDVHPSGRYFELQESSRVIVDPPSAFARWFGLALGITGPVFFFGSAYYGLRHETGVEGTHHEPGEVWLAVAGIAALGVVTPVGWIMFGVNHAPGVTVEPAH